MDIALNRLSAESLMALQAYCMNLLDAHKNYGELRSKAEVIDTDYYRYQTESDRKAGEQHVGVTVDNLVIPIVISQVDSFVGYMAETYLSGYPLFPVVSSPDTLELADKMEAVIDEHATLGGYARELLKAFHSGMRYNFMPILSEWCELPSYSAVPDVLNAKNATKIQESVKGFTKIKSLNLYNTVWDYRFSPADNSTRGDVVGYIDRASKMEVRMLMLQLQRKRIAYQQDKWSQIPSGATSSIYWTDVPQVSQYITNNRNKGMDWNDWLGIRDPGVSGRKVLLKQGSYEVDVLYVRIIPDEYNISVPSPKYPQIFKCYLLNGQLLIGVERVISPFSRMPIEIGMPIEDNFGLQTPSIAEAQGGFQVAASTLFNIRIQAARRAVADRGIFNEDMIRSVDINSPLATAKVPARLRGLGENAKLSDAYMPIPFQSQGLELTISNINDVMRYSDVLSGLNKPQQGQFQKGNKSVDEWRDTMGNADNRLRLPVLNTEFQVMVALKETIKFNLFMHPSAGIYTNNKSGEGVKVSPDDFNKMQEAGLKFRIADGYTPKSKMAGTDVISSMLQSILASPILLQLFGNQAPRMVAHLMQLMGVRDFAQYAPAELTQVPEPGQNGQPAAAAGQPQ